MQHIHSMTPYPFTLTPSVPCPRTLPLPTQLLSTPFTPCSCSLYPLTPTPSTLFLFTLRSQTPRQAIQLPPHSYTPYPLTPPLIRPVTCVSTTNITPTEPMHVDPVAETFVTHPIHQAIASVSHAYLLYQIHTCIKDMHARFVKFHFLTLFSCWSQRELDAEFWIANKGVRYLGGHL
jgi:hypothetical protein